MSKQPKAQDIIDNKLLEDRKVFLWGMVDDKSAKHVIDRLLYLDALETKDIQLYINSPGGYVTSGFAMYDCIKSLNSDVSTICTGLAASMGSILLSVGTKGKRFIQPHARVMIHQPSGGARGQASDIEITYQEIQKIKEELYSIISDHSGQTVKKIEKDGDRDYWMRAPEAKAYGMIDDVLTKKQTEK